MQGPLSGKVALVAGATQGAGRGIAVELGAAGATVYATGRSTRSERSEMDRPETIEETAALVDAAGGRGIAEPRSTTRRTTGSRSSTTSPRPRTSGWRSRSRTS